METNGNHDGPWMAMALLLRPLRHRKDLRGLRNRRHGIHHLFHLEAHLHLGRNDFFCALRIQ